MSIRVLSAGILCAILAAVGSAPANAATRGYVVRWMGEAFRFDPSGKTDCAEGTNPPVDWRKAMATPLRTSAEVERLVDPTNYLELRRQAPLRGPNGEDVYEHPEAIPDPHLVEPRTALAEGFNLDGDATTGFRGPAGEPGVDNQWYRVAGCLLAFRGPRGQGGIATRLYNKWMLSGAYAILIEITGIDDPANDDSVDVNFYASLDPIVMTSRGEVSEGDSYRIDPNPAVTGRLHGRIRDGVLETDPVARLQMRRRSAPNETEVQTVFENARLRATFNADGSLSATLGGYRDWDEIYRKITKDGARFEIETHVQLPAIYYALKRYADGPVDPKTGRRATISTAYWIDATPAFVVRPTSVAAAAP